MDGDIQAGMGMGSLSNGGDRESHQGPNERGTFSLYDGIIPQDSQGMLEEDKAKLERVMQKYRWFIETMDTLRRLDEQPIDEADLDLRNKEGIELIAEQIEGCSCSWCLDTLNHLRLLKWSRFIELLVLVQGNSVIQGMGLEAQPAILRQDNDIIQEMGLGALGLDIPIALCGATCVWKKWTCNVPQC